MSATTARPTPAAADRAARRAARALVAVLPRKRENAAEREDAREIAAAGIAYLGDAGDTGWAIEEARWAIPIATARGRRAARIADRAAAILGAAAVAE